VADNFLFSIFVGYCMFVYLAYLPKGWRQSVLAVMAGSIWIAHLPPSNATLKYIYLFILICGYFATQKSGSKKIRNDLLMFSYLSACLIWMTLVVGFNALEFDPLFKLLIIAPLSLVVGFQATQSAESSNFYKSFMSQGIFFSSLALLEFLTGGDWIPQRINEFVYINASGRVRLFTEHPLVLAILLSLLSVLIVNSSMNSLKKNLSILIVFFSSLTTQTVSAPILILLIYAISILSKIFGLTLQANFRAMRLVLANFFIFALLASATLNPFAPLLLIPGDIASALYRFVIYGLMWVILASHPLGFGALGIPEGLYSIPSVYGDLALTSLDAELVYSVAQFGYFGFFPYVVMFGSLYFLRTVTQSRLVLVVILFSSLFASIHSWISLTIAFFFVIGSSATIRTLGNDQKVLSSPKREELNYEA